MFNFVAAMTITAAILALVAPSALPALLTALVFGMLAGAVGIVAWYTARAFLGR